MINNRQQQAGRRRGRGNSGSGGNNGQRSQGGSPGRGDTGNRIDSRARGNASQLHEKYKNLARDAQMQGDRVNIEYYLQFADHYFRVLSETRSRFEENQPRRQQFDDGFDGGDEEYGDEGEPIRSGEQSQDDQRGDRAPRYDNQREQRPQQRDGQNRDGQQRDSQQRDYQSRDGQSRDGQRDQQRDQQQGQSRDSQPRDYQRDQQPRDDRPRYDAQRDERQERPRDERPREDRPREDRPRRDGRATRANGNQAIVTDEHQPPAANDAAERPAAAAPVPMQTQDDVQPQAPVAEEQPRRRGRPRRDRSAEEAAVPQALDADRLPPSLSLSALPDRIVPERSAPQPEQASPEQASSEHAGDAPEEKPRRRRVRAASGEVQAG